LCCAIGSSTGNYGHKQQQFIIIVIIDEVVGSSDSIIQCVHDKQEQQQHCWYHRQPHKQLIHQDSIHFVIAGSSPIDDIGALYLS
jgi:hypothetical protein